MSALPNSINYAEQIPSLPENTKSYTLTSTPVNGASFTPSQVIQVDLARSGFIVPDSIYMRYRVVVASATTASEMIGTPVYAPIQRLDVLFGSQNAQNIQDYNQVANMLTNLRHNVADKVSSVTSYGWKIEGDANVIAQRGKLRDNEKTS